MTSPKSFQNNFGYAYRTGLRDNAFATVIQFFIGIALFIVGPAQTLFKTSSYNPNTQMIETINIKEEYKYYLCMDINYMQQFIILLFLGVGILMGIATFKFMVGKKTMNVYYSLGIKRVHLFSAKYLSGITLIAASIFAPILVGVILNLATVGASRELMMAASYYFLGLFSLSAFAFSLTAMVFSAVGTIFEGVFFSVILISFPQALLMILESLISQLVLGTPYGSTFSDSYSVASVNLTARFKNANPFSYLSEGLTRYNATNAKGELLDKMGGKSLPFTAPDFLTVLIWLFVTVAFFVAAMYIYEHRKAEIGGFIGKNKGLNFLCTFLIGIFAFASILSMSAIAKLHVALQLLIGLFVFAAVYVVMEFVLIRNAKEFKKGIYKLPIHLGIATLIFVFFATGYFGFGNRVPEVTKIQNAKISTIYTNYSHDAGGDAWSLGYNTINTNGNRLPSGDYTSEKDLTTIAEIHHMMIASGKEAKKNSSVTKGLYPAKIKIIYTLKNGKQVLRSYYGIPESVYQKMYDLDKGDYRSARLKEAFFGDYKEYDAKEISQIFQNRDDALRYQFYFDRYKQALQSDEGKIYLYNKMLENQELTLTPQQHKELLNCLYEDITNMSGAELYTPKETFGILGFSLPYMEQQQWPMTQEDAELENEAEKPYIKIEMNAYDTAYNTMPNFFISPEMTKTIAFLKEIGVYDYLTAKPEITEIMLLNQHGDDSVILNSNYEYGREVFAYPEVKTESWYQYKSTDKALIDSLYKQANMRQMLNLEETYLVCFVNGEVATKMCIPKEAIPKDILETINTTAPKIDANYKG